MDKTKPCSLATYSQRTQNEKHIIYTGVVSYLFVSECNFNRNSLHLKLLLQSISVVAGSITYPLRIVCRANPVYSPIFKLKTHTAARL